MKNNLFKTFKIHKVAQNILYGNKFSMGYTKTIEKNRKYPVIYQEPARSMGDAFVTYIEPNKTIRQGGGKDFYSSSDEYGLQETSPLISAFRHAKQKGHDVVRMSGYEQENEGPFINVNKALHVWKTQIPRSDKTVSQNDDSSYYDKDSDAYMKILDNASVKGDLRGPLVAHQPKVFPYIEEAKHKYYTDRYGPNYFVHDKWGIPSYPDNFKDSKEGKKFFKEEGRKLMKNNAKLTWKD